MRSREENIGITAMIAMIVIVVSVKFFIGKKVEAKGGYVIAHLIKSSFEGSEMGWVHDFEYTFGNKKYFRSFGGPISEFVLKDSLMFIKVSIDSPTLSFDIQNVRVPKCLSANDNPSLGWKEIPTCDTLLQ